MKKAIPITVYNLWSSVVIAGSDPAPIEDLSDCDNITSFSDDNQDDKDCQDASKHSNIDVDVNLSSPMQVLDISDDSDNSAAKPPSQTKGKVRVVLKYPRMLPCHISMLYRLLPVWYY